MKVRLSRIWLYSVCSTLGLLALLWGMSAALAQAPPGERQPQADTSGAATVNSRINYQGELRESGVPVTGKRTMTVRLYSNSSCANLLQTISLGSVTVTDGRFSVAVSVSNDLFYGRGVWLRLTVGTTPMTCQELLPVPYALSLRPGAIIDGAASGSGLGKAILNIQNLAPSSSGVTNGIYVNSVTRTAVSAWAFYGVGVYGRSSTTYAVRGESVDWSGGCFDSQGGHGLVATTTSTKTNHYGGYFSAKVAYAVHARSELNTAIRGVGGTDLSGVALPAVPVGVAGLSATHTGVWGASRESVGVSGYADAGAGVRGESDSGPGVDAQSKSGVGLFAFSSSGAAIFGVSGSGSLMELYDTDTDPHNRRFDVSNDGRVWADGRFNAWGHCLAVHIDVSESVQPGDVVAIDDDYPGRFRLSRWEYSTLVVGVVSSPLSPFVVGGAEADTRPLLVLAGRTLVKVSTENGAIAPGDLLVASSTAGYAMRADSNPPHGAVIGKALESLAAGQGQIAMVAMAR
jgi:hypothetical protein